MIIYYEKKVQNFEKKSYYNFWKNAKNIIFKVIQVILSDYMWF